MGIDRLTTVLMGGFSDLVTLPHLAVLALWGVFLMMASEDRALTVRILSGFILGYLPVVFLLRVGLFNAPLLTGMYYSCVMFFYSGIGLLLIAAGGAFAFGWYRYYRSEVKQALFSKIRSSGSLALYWMLPLGFFAGALFAVANFCWPVNLAVMVLANEMFLPGLLWATVWSIFIYEMVFVLVVLAFLFVFLYFSAEDRVFPLDKRRSLLLAVLAGIYMALGVGLVAVFIKQMA